MLLGIATIVFFSSLFVGWLLMMFKVTYHTQYGSGFKISTETARRIEKFCFWLFVLATVFYLVAVFTSIDY